MSHLIDAEWREGGQRPLQSLDPANGDALWQGYCAAEAEVEAATTAARLALRAWADTPLAVRIGVLEAFRDQIEAQRNSLIELLSRETGRPRWDSQQEVMALIGRVALVIAAHQERNADQVRESPSLRAALRHRPLGVLALLMPAVHPLLTTASYLLPALLAGNCVLLKPSPLTPFICERLAVALRQAGLPPGVLNLLQGDEHSGQLLAQHADVDGVFFVGSDQNGQQLHRDLAGQPQRALVLSMGGNNPLLVYRTQHLAAAVQLTLLSAFTSSAQRCTCARRLVLVDNDESEQFIEALKQAISQLRVGGWNELPEPFLGPMLSPRHRHDLLNQQQQLCDIGGDQLVAATAIDANGAFIRPGLIDLTTATQVPDCELFGPLLQLYRCPDFDSALEQANRTRYGLSAGLISDDESVYREFTRRIHAGVLSWNRPMTQISAAAPFGGLGLSGNLRPAGYHAVDFCAYPISSLETDYPDLAENPPPGLSN